MLFCDSALEIWLVWYSAIHLFLYFHRAAFDIIQAPPASEDVVKSLRTVTMTADHIGKYAVLFIKDWNEIQV